MKSWKLARSIPDVYVPATREEREAMYPITKMVLECPFRKKTPNCGCIGKWRCERDSVDVTLLDCQSCKQKECMAEAIELCFWRGGVDSDAG